MSGRLTIEEYALRLAEVVALRSEDPYNRVGAVAVTDENRIIATGYNGLLPGFTPPKGFWDNRDSRLKYMVHAEQNLCSLFKRGEAKLVAITISPCPTCITLLASHGVSQIIFRAKYERMWDLSLDVARFYGLRFELKENLCK